MKLGIAYHVFSGLEFLRPSLLNVRPFAQYIVGVYSKTSYMGHPAPEYMMDLLYDLLEEELLDDITEYVPNIVKGADGVPEQHRKKREQGRLVCMAQGCSHFMSKDADEFYETRQLQQYWNELTSCDFTAAPTITYYRSPHNQAKEPDRYHVPLIHDVRLPFEVQLQYLTQPQLDMSRTVSGAASTRIFNAQEILVHHFNRVRINAQEVERKRQGHGHYNHFTHDEFLADMASWPEDGVKRAPDQFNIFPYWHGEFQKYVK